MNLGDFSVNRSNRARLSRFLKGEALILRGVSALKYMELFVDDHFTFDVKTERIFVYAKEALTGGNFDVKIVPNFSDIHYDDAGSVLCSTLSQVVHDALDEPGLVSQDVLVEALANYYEEVGHFEDVEIKAMHLAEFQRLKALAMSFYEVT